MKYQTDILLYGMLFLDIFVTYFLFCCYCTEPGIIKRGNLPPPPVPENKKENEDSQSNDNEKNENNDINTDQ